MTSDEKKELRRLAYWLAGVCVLYLIMPKTYPPRTLSSTDYCFWAFIPLGAFCSVRPGVSRRWLVYYGVLGAIPFVLEMEYKLGVPYRIRPDAFEPRILYGVYLPCIFLFLKLAAATVVMGFVARRAKAKCEVAPHEE
jgi:hypothetical protein